MRDDGLKEFQVKKPSPFVNFDVEKFYPPIFKKILTNAVRSKKCTIFTTIVLSPKRNAVRCAKSLIDIAEEEYSIIIYSKKILIFQKLQTM